MIFVVIQKFLPAKGCRYKFCIINMFNRKSLKDTTQIPANDLPRGLTIDSTIEEFQNIFNHRLIIEWEDLNARIPLMKKCFIDNVLNIPLPKSARMFNDSSLN